MKECALCSHSANLTGEHVMSDWMNALFPMSSQGKWMGIRTDEKGQITEWQSKSLDQKARVVCEECNGTWMSDIESQHAKPVMTPLIQGELHIPLSQPNARSIALFAFKPRSFSTIVNEVGSLSFRVAFAMLSDVTSTSPRTFRCGCVFMLPRVEEPTLKWDITRESFHPPIPFSFMCVPMGSVTLLFKSWQRSNSRHACSRPSTRPLTTCRYPSGLKFHLNLLGLYPEHWAASKSLRAITDDGTKSTKSTELVRIVTC